MFEDMFEDIFMVDPTLENEYQNPDLILCVF